MSDVTEKTKAKTVTVKAWKFLLVMFIIGLAFGSCSLGMKLPVALYDLATGHQ